MPYVPPGTDQLAVPKPQPGKSYRWLADDRDRLQGHLLSHGGRPGWRLCRGKNVVETRGIAETLGFNETHVDEATNTIKYGRLILADIPTTEYQLRLREKKAEALALQEAEGDAAIDRMAQKGINAVAREPEEWEDRRKFAAEDTPRVSLAGLDIPRRA